MSHYDEQRELYEEKLRGITIKPYFEQESYTDTQEQVVVYAVLAWIDNYPNSDNVKGMFDSYSKAEQFMDKYKKQREVMNNVYDNYEIVDYVLNQET